MRLLVLFCLPCLCVVQCDSSQCVCTATSSVQGCDKRSSPMSTMCDTINTFDYKRSISLKKPARQSSTYQDSDIYNASKAVDGDRQNSEYAHTKNESMPWWRVDLGAEYHIQGVSILTIHLPGLEHRLHDFEVRVGDLDPVKNDKDTRITRNLLCHYFSGHGLKNEQLYSMSCVQGLVGRFVSIQIIRHCETCSEKTSNWLILGDVDVYGCPA